MIRSMTGYGEAERDTRAGRMRAEIRTVNHRYFSVNLRLARALERYEPQVRECLRAQLPRGHVNCAIRWETDGVTPAGGRLRVDEARARAYVDAFQTIKQRLGVAGDVDLALLARFGDIVVPEEDDSSEAAVSVDDVCAVVEAAALSTVRMREDEGVRLAQDLELRLRAIEAALEEVERRAPQRLVTERDRMRRVVGDLLGEIQPDDERIAREIAHLAERLDVSEEIVRLRSHIELFRATVAQDAAEPVGKRLAFLAQEMNRETNTIGSKANDAPIEHSVIAIKDEIERLREQIENVE